MAAPRAAAIGRVVNAIEEGIIALLFAAMPLVTFVQVVARYVFDCSSRAFVVRALPENS